MSDRTYPRTEPIADRPLVWLKGEVKTPPFSDTARRQAGWLLRRLQRGETLGMPESRPLSALGRRCHELRVREHGSGKTWRIIYRIDADAIVVVEVFAKQSQKTPRTAVANARRRLAEYDAVSWKE